MKAFFRRIGAGTLLGALLAPSVGFAQVSSDQAADFVALPPVTTPSTPPLVMLAMSVDHELFKKAYTDYSDLDQDGTLDISYNDSFDYYGYFDSGFCYSYDLGSQKFQPLGTGDGPNGHRCDDPTKGGWSGNFLNWASMTRIDVVRRVLYGGLRSTDTSGTTVLERAELPKDIHAFSKVYTGADVHHFTPYTVSDLGGDSISLCSLTPSAGADPLIRVAKGAWPRWSASEVRQCQWNNTASSPTDPGHKMTEAVARVQVCVSGQDASADRCQAYPSGNIKPFGLLQQYGEEGEIRFGLLSGSYNENISGGVLRRNVSQLANNASPADDEIDTHTGIFTGNDGIIRTIDLLKVSKYNYGASSYDDCSTHSITVSDFKTSADAGRQCKDWGNPLGEIYLEALRYMSGNTSPTAAFDTTDSGYVAGLPSSSVAWVDPMSSDQWCANCSIVVLSTGLNSFDTDDLTSAADIPGIASAAVVNDLTDVVGGLEYSGGFAGDYLVGGSDGRCTPKALSSLSEAKGICPEIPALEGGYQAAGLAYHARTQDLRPTTAFPGIQTLSTYAVALSENLPQFVIPAGSGAVSLIPFCESNRGGGTPAVDDSRWQGCSMVNVQIESMNFNAGVLESGSMIVYWEDSLWGADYDLDGAQRLEFCAGSACSPAVAADQVQVITSVPHAYAGNALRFGYIVAGTDGTVLYNGVSDSSHAGDGFNANRLVVRPGNVNFSTLDNDNPHRAPAPKTHLFTADPSGGAALLRDPLYFTAKYGGFEDYDLDATPGFDGDGDGLPDALDHREWDQRNLRGDLVAGGDGYPDNYYPVRNPGLLEQSLGEVFSAILGEVASGTAAAVVANSSTGTGAVYQALYHPSIENNNKEVRWAGTLQALLIDSSGRLREDNPSSGTAGALDGCDVDPVVELFFDDQNTPFGTKIRRYASASADCTSLGTPVVLQLEALQPLWNAVDGLAALTDPSTQRVYSVQADHATSGGRHILTAFNGVVADFDAATVDSSNFGYFNVATESEADVVVRWVRGEEGLPGTRSRTLDFDSSTPGDEAWRLGDIIHSTPAVVGSPQARYDLLYGDSSYTAFRAQYAGRRQVVYVGGNDGMIHAFNGGFWNESTLGFDATNGAGAVAHPLGAELWAYVPENLLPHLKWLPAPDYEHIYYVDGAPKTYDVRIFPDDSTHPGGWGTILVVGMRFGGGAVTVDTAADGLGLSDANADTSDDRAFRSAYVVLDVTDPEQAPTLVAEITHAELGFTTGEPELFKQVDLVAGTDTWELVFGSGPTVLSDATSTQHARLYRYDLEAGGFVTGYGPSILLLDDPNSFVGSPRAVDWNLDYQDDAFFFGLASGTAGNMDGALKWFNQSLLSVSTLIDTAAPVIPAPMTAVDGYGERWVYFATGKMLSSTDRADTSQQAIYGVKEPAWSLLPPAAVDPADLLDSADVHVFDNGDVTQSDGSRLRIDSDWIDTFDDLGIKMASMPGWRLELTANGTDPSERVLNAGARVADLVLFTSHEPASATSCDAGDAYLRVMHYQTGTAAPFAPLGTDSSVTHNSGELALDAYHLGPGIASSPVIHSGAGGDGVTVITQQSTGTVSGTGVGLAPVGQVRQSWIELDPQDVFYE